MSAYVPKVGDRVRLLESQKLKTSDKFLDLRDYIGEQGSVVDVDEREVRVRVGDVEGWSEFNWPVDAVSFANRATTRRERIATACLSGFLASEEFGSASPQRLASYCVEQADALIAELDK